MVFPLKKKNINFFYTVTGISLRTLDVNEHNATTEGEHCGNDVIHFENIFEGTKLVSRFVSIDSLRVICFEYLKLISMRSPSSTQYVTESVSPEKLSWFRYLKN